MTEKEKRILIGNYTIDRPSREEAIDAALELAAGGVEAIQEATGISAPGIVEELHTGKELGRVYPRIKGSRGKQFAGLSPSQYESIFGKKKAG